MEVFRVPEKTTARYSVTLKDENKTPIPLSDLTTVTLTIYDLDGFAQSIINSRNAQSIRNVNGGTVGATDGSVVVLLSMADTSMIDSTLDAERHKLLIEFTYNGGTKAGRHECVLLIIGAAKVS